MQLNRSFSWKTARVVAGLGLSVLLACSDSDSGSEHDDEHGSGGAGGATSAGGKGGTGGSKSSAGAGGKAAGAGAGGKAASGSAGDQAEAGAGGSAGHAGGGGHTGGSGGGSAAGSGGSSAGNGGSSATGGSGGAGGSGSQSGVAVTIRFKAKVGSQDFACGQEYDAQGSMNTKMTGQDFRMFVQDLALIRADDTLVPVQLDVRAPWQSDKVALLDFEDGSGACAGGTSGLNKELTGRVPEGDYKGVAFSNGVPEDINHTDPATQADPLKTHADLSWGWLTGFRFSKLEMIQVVPAGQVFGVGLVHPGTTACTGNPMQNTVVCTKSNRNKIKLQPFDATSDSVLIDIGAVFKETNLTEDAECHSSGSYCTSMFNALGINFADGKERDGQTVFTVE